jgi:hypothetical protein
MDKSKIEKMSGALGRLSLSGILLLTTFYVTQTSKSHNSTNSCKPFENKDWRRTIQNTSRRDNVNPRKRPRAERSLSVAGPGRTAVFTYVHSPAVVIAACCSTRLKSAGEVEVDIGSCL